MIVLILFSNSFVCVCVRERECVCVCVYILLQKTITKLIFFSIIVMLLFN